MVEKLVTLAKNNLEGKVDASDRVAAIRQAGKFVRGRDALYKLFNDLGERFVERPGGYTRIMRNGTRLGDNAQMAIIQFVDYQMDSVALDEDLEVAEAEVVEEAAEA
jgi:large subunit ribosomal protein L17